MRVQSRKCLQEIEFYNDNYKLKKLLLLFLFFFIVFDCFAQPSIEWAKCYGGSFDDRANSIVQASNGDYVIAGSTNSSDANVTGFHGGQDIWVIRIDSSGNLLWEKCYGGTNVEKAFSICKTFDNEFIIAGICYSTDGDVTSNYGGSDYWIIKIDSSGNLLWQKSYGGSNEDFAYSIVQINDSGYVIAGYTSSNDDNVTGNNGLEDFWIIKIDNVGNIIWQKCFGGSNHEFATTIKQLTNGNYIISGVTYSNDSIVSGNHGSSDYWLIQIDPVGNLLSQKCFGGTYPEQQGAFECTSDKGFIMSGTSYSNDGDVSGNRGVDDFWIVRLDSLFNIVWQKCLGGTGEEFYSFVKETPDGGCIVTGTTDSQTSLVNYNYHGYDDYILIKLDISGNIEWEWCYGGTNDDDALGVLLTSNSNYLVAGFSSSYNRDVIGQHSVLDVYHDFWIMKTGNTIAKISEIKNSKSEITIYPNPTAKTFTIENISSNGISLLQLLNPLGEIVYTEKLFGKNEYVVDANFAKGIYFISLSDGEKFIMRKLVVE